MADNVRSGDLNMNHSAKHHLWLMLLCCLIPIAALGAIFLFKIPTSSVLYVGLFLLCPILHFWMMKGMMGHRHGDETAPEQQASVIEDN
jgi:hypothetical protein